MRFFRRFDDAAVSCLVASVKIYKKFVSPLFPCACRFHPTCSQYAIDALRMRGAVVGTCLAAWRLLRCNPLFPGGIDEVPEKRGSKRGRDGVRGNFGK